MTWTGALALSVLAMIFLLQGVAELAHNESLTHFVYQVLGQRTEAWAGDLFLLWCIAVVVIDSRGWTRMLGAVALALVVGCGDMRTTCPIAVRRSTRQRRH